MKVTGKEKGNLSQFVDDTTLYIGDPKDSTKKIMVTYKRIQ